MCTATGRFLPLPAMSASPVHTCLTSSASRLVPVDADASWVHTIDLCRDVLQGVSVRKLPHSDAERGQV